MRAFLCPVCDSRLYFENTQCTACGTLVGFNADTCDFEALGDGQPGSMVWCENNANSGCNWLVRAGDEQTFCIACQLNELIPPIDDPEQKRRWTDVEIAKRRLIYSVIRLGIPIYPKRADPSGLSFLILVDAEHGGVGQVTMGHENGVITIDATEADAHQREFRRAELDERYRTMVGHMRHESGHYFWERLAQLDGFLDAFRAQFGDEREDYGEALQRHYENGAPADWPISFISAYATSHPWEDWAECFAHYLHVVDGVETALSFGISGRKVARSFGQIDDGETASHQDHDPYRTGHVEETLAHWAGLTVLMNVMSRSLGHEDYYPFIVNDAVATKLGFIDDWMGRLAQAA